jgi:hypothetical protein
MGPIMRPVGHLPRGLKRDKASEPEMYPPVGHGLSGLDPDPQPEALAVPSAAWVPVPTLKQTSQFPGGPHPHRQHRSF